MAASNLNLGKASGGVLNIQPADGTTTTSLVLPAINGTVVAADSNGNVGIGKIPNPWRSDLKAIEHLAGAFVAIGSTDSALLQNATLTSGGWIRNSGLPSSMYEQANGGHYWSTAPSGTAGNAITWTNAMLIENNTHTTIGSPVSSNTTGAQLRVEQAANNDASTASLIISRYNDNYSSALWHCYNTVYNQEAFNLSVSPAVGGSSLTTSYKKYMALGNGNHFWYGATTSNQTMTLDANGNLTLNSGTGGLGYGTGSGGTVTQLTSKSTSVTLNKPTGQIIMNNAALAAGASVYFTLNNSLISGVGDQINISVLSSTLYLVDKTIVSNSGYVIIKVTNNSGGSLSDSLVLTFSITKGAIS